MKLYKYLEKISDNELANICEDIKLYVYESEIEKYRYLKELSDYYADKNIVTIIAEVDIEVRDRFISKFNK